MDFLRNLFRHGQQDRKAASAQTKYNVQCSVETVSPHPIPSMVPLEATAEVLPTGLVIGFGNAYSDPKDRFSRMLQIGLFQTLAGDDSDGPITMSYDAMDRVAGKLLVETGKNSRKVLKKIDQAHSAKLSKGQLFEVEITYSNVRKGTTLTVGIVVERARLEEAPNETLALYHQILASKSVCHSSPVS